MDNSLELQACALGAGNGDGVALAGEALSPPL
jgi:hypothetical protein